MKRERRGGGKGLCWPIIISIENRRGKG